MKLFKRKNDRAAPELIPASREAESCPVLPFSADPVEKELFTGSAVQYLSSMRRS